jgi:hypothetical protein
LDHRAEVVAVLGQSAWLRDATGAWERHLPSFEATNSTNCLPPDTNLRFVRGTLTFTDRDGGVGVFADGSWWVAPPGAVREGDDMHSDSVWRVRGGFVISVEHPGGDGLTGRALLVIFGDHEARTPSRDK